MDRSSNPTMLLGDDATEQVPIDAIVQLFGQDCFTVSDLRQVGLPLIFVSPSFESVMLPATNPRRRSGGT